MAINIYEKFAPRANPADGDYPYGSIKNESVPGAKDGTPLDAEWGNDYAGFDAELFAQTGTVPSGIPDKLGASQRVDATNILAVSRALNAPVGAVVASSAVGLELDGVSHIFEDTLKKTWKKPINVGLGETLVSVSPLGVLTTSASSYNMVVVELASTPFTDPIAPTYLKTLSDIVNGDEISILRFIDTTKHSAIRNRTSTYDATADVQNAVDTMKIANRSGLFAPAGLYNLDSGVDVEGSMTDAFSMRGEGRRTIFKTTNAVNCFTFRGDPSNTFQYVRLSNFAVQAANAGASGILTKNTELAQFSKLIFTGAGLAGINMSPTGGDSDIKPMVHECVFGGGLQHGILGGDTRVADGSFKDNFFIDLVTSCITMGYADGGTFTGNKMFSNLVSGLKGFNLKRPIYVYVADNDFFELGGVGLLLTSPRHSIFENNRLINVGNNGALPAVQVLDFDSSTPGLNNSFTRNTIKDIAGRGLVVNSTKSIQSDYTIEDNRFINVGKSGTVHDAIELTNCSDFSIRKNKVTTNEVTNKTRYWLNLNNSSDITLQGNKHVGLGNPDVFTANSTMIIEDSRRILTGVITTITLAFDDDGVIGGTLTSSITINLPPANRCPGKTIQARWTSGAFSMILDPAATQTIDGASTLNVNSANPKVTLISDGANWFTI